MASLSSAFPPARSAAVRRLAPGLALAALASVPLWASPFYLDFATQILVFALFAMSLDLLVGYTGLVSLGHAAFFGIGAYATALLLERGVLGLAWVLPASALAAGLAALAIGALAVRTAGVSFIMITLALAQMVYAVAVNAPWTGSTNGMLLAQRPLTGIPGIDLEQPVAFYGYCLLLAALGYGVMRRLVDSPFGRALQGIRANPERMEAMGYRIARYRLVVFVQAGVLAGIAGHLYAASQFFIDPGSLHWSASGQVLMMVVLGGEGTLLGPALGAAIFLGLEQGISGYTEHWMLPMGLILVALVLAGRGGLVRLAGRSFEALRLRMGIPRAPAAPAGEGSPAHAATGSSAGAVPPPLPFTRPGAAAEQEPPGKAAPRGPILETLGLTKNFGALRVSHAIDLAIAPGETRAVIGPNGAGKTSLVNQIAGQLRPDRGAIRFRGRDIQGLPPDRVARLGIGRSFQRSNLFPAFTVFENVRLAAQEIALARAPGRLPPWLHCWRPAARHDSILRAAERVLAQVGLLGRARDLAGALSHGEQRQLELAMVLALEPELLLLDEPMAGLSLEESRRLTALLAGLKGTHTMLLIEHDMDAVFALADAITVLVYGQVIATGDAAAIRADPAVREAYLGEE